MRFLLLVLVALTLACGPSGQQSHERGPAVVYVDSAFTQTERAALVKAMGTWTLAVGKAWGPLRLCQHGEDCDRLAAGARDDTLVLVRTVSTDPALPEDVRGSGGVLAFADEIPGNRVTFLMDHVLKYEENLEAVTLHELGHILGLYHLPVKSSLMFPYSQGMTCVDVTTMLEYAVFHPEVPRNQLSWNCPTDLDLHASSRAIDPITD